MSTIKVSAVFNLPPSFCERSNIFVDNSKLGLKIIGKTIREIFPHQMYAYQICAIKALLKGKDNLIAVGTGSGKSESFLFPMFERIVNGEIKNAILIYPTKQLAEDQEKRIAKYCNKIQEITGEKITYSRYNGDLTQKEIDFVEKVKPNIILATIDKLFYRCFKEGKEDFLDWLLNAGMLVIDEVHAGSGSYLEHVRETVTVLKYVNPKMSVVLASATVRNVEKLRDEFLPSAEIFQGKARRGKVTVMVLDPEKLTSFLLEKLEPHMKKIRGVAIVFVDSIQKVGEIVAKCNKHLMITLGLTKEQVLAHTPFVCINSQLTRKEKSAIIDRIHKGLVRIVFTTSLMELGMDIPNIQHIVNIGWPITGVNGLLQRIGRLRFPDIEKKKNFTIFLDEKKNDRQILYQEQKDFRENISGKQSRKDTI
ncbi:MAG: DEAD/DEAH box helicase [Candidatus Heimdallarchaeota archaeon]